MDEKLPNSNNLKPPENTQTSASTTVDITSVLEQMEILLGALKQIVQAGGKILIRQEIEGILKLLVYLPEHKFTVKQGQQVNSPEVTVLLDGIPLQDYARIEAKREKELQKDEA